MGLKQSPNIILIMADDQILRTLGKIAQEMIKTVDVRFIERRVDLIENTER